MFKRKIVPVLVGLHRINEYNLEKIYRCPIDGTNINDGFAMCPSCGRKIDWHCCKIDGSRYIFLYDISPKPVSATPQELMFQK